MSAAHPTPSPPRPPPAPSARPDPDPPSAARPPAPPAATATSAPPARRTLVVTVTLGAKTCNLNRPVDESLEKALTRLAKNLISKPSKKDKRKKPGAGPAGAGAGAGSVSGADTSTDEPGLAPAALYEDEAGTRPLDRSLPNGEAWLRAALLEVAGERFLVEINPPTVDKISIDRLAMVGYPTAAAVTLSHAEPALCRWRWSAQRPGARPADPWVDLGCASQHYTPTAGDEGSVLRVECTPGGRRPPRRQEGEAAAAAAELERWEGETVSATTGPVQHGPARCSATVRRPATPGPLATRGSFRILSYNILADQYAGSDYAQNVLFNYCPKECLDPGYRRPLVLRELLGFAADVVCLQEVDERAFTDFLSLHLGLHGYSGHYTNKMGRVKEGSATFWRTARFSALAHADIRLRDAFRRPLPPLHSQFAPLLDASPELEKALQQVTTIAQATLLAPADWETGHSDADSVEGCLCVVNTHLFFHPYAPHIRTMHTAAILEEAAAFLERCAASADPRVAAAAGAGGRRRPTVLFVGDLNSDLNDGIPGVVELLRRGKLPADYWDWVQGAAFKWGMGEEDAEAMAQGTAQIAAAAAGSNSTGDAATAAADGPAGPAATSATTSTAAAAAVGSLFAPDGHAFDGAAAAPERPIPVTGIDLTLPYRLRSADDLATPYTNYTSGYKALLDYVWYEEAALRVVATAPIPTEEELGSFIPSPAFPSDHLAVVYDMEWRREGDGGEVAG
ncbi:hypothetical protein GPECTOR_30g228 [Gonium pectorale]|uniref:Endonuclease/exonuclease/phosphatase domain-containing protein n=1 Tax=Gonium pectorale TaxID=33097 RepID=A0A150GE70_GONPE|nr:hypothetical protein GPECTOR_30g228 [Gonium pectorale]|eukprot:KXZ48132.1 hypothetical protein GPECTOR_30g228 [Gonium pectorale]